VKVDQNIHLFMSVLIWIALYNYMQLNTVYIAGKK